MTSSSGNRSSLSIEYSFADFNSARLDAVLAELEREIGGKRAPYGQRPGAIDLVTFLELTLTCVVGSTLPQLFKKYAEGFLDADSIKKIDESHRVELRNWYSTAKHWINSIIHSLNASGALLQSLHLKTKKNALPLCLAFQTEQDVM
jgi:hypothetical protein